MRVLRARLAPIRLRLRAPLDTARGALAERRGVLLRLDTDDGRVGWGEATPVAGFGQESAEAAGDALAKLAALAVGREPRELDALLDRAERLAPEHPAARFALDTALHDLVAQGEGRSLASWLASRRRAGARAAVRVAVHALLSARDPDGAADEALRLVAQGFRTLKLKLGAAAPERDLARVAAVRAAVGPRIALRLDANGAWSPDDAVVHLLALAPFAPEWIEQPVPAEDVAGLARVRARAGVPVAADESATTRERAEAVIAAGAADLLVLKPAAAGGLRAAARLAELAREAGLAVVVTSVLDGAVGRAAALALAASLPGPLPACGLATGALLADDLAPDPPVVRGALAVPPGPGLGCAPDPARLAGVSVASGFELAAAG